MAIKRSDHQRQGAGSSGPQHVLVTGGAGFIGANLVRLLLDHGYQVTVLDNLVSGRREYLDDLPIEFIHGDILDRRTVQRAVSKTDGVVHLAAQTGVPGSLHNPRKDCEVNVFGTLNLLEACRAEKERSDAETHGADGSRLRFIFASSNAPLGRQAPPAKEDKVPLPISPYGASKLAGEAYCLAYYGSWGLETVALRFGNVYGPFSGHKNSVVAKLFKDIVASGKVVVDGDGEQTRDFINVEDLCQAILLALESNVRGEIVQIATGVETSIRSLVCLVREVAGRGVQLDQGPARQGDIRRNYSDVSKAKALLGWEPRVPLAQGLHAAWQWFESTTKCEPSCTSSMSRVDS
jgi:UDP-glucose 4-epimerase